MAMASVYLTGKKIKIRWGISLTPTWRALSSARWVSSGGCGGEQLASPGWRCVYGPKVDVKDSASEYSTWSRFLCIKYFLRFILKHTPSSSETRQHWLCSPDCLSTTGQSLRWREMWWEWASGSDSAGQGVYCEEYTLVLKLKRWLLW